MQEISIVNNKIKAYAISVKKSLILISLFFKGEYHPLGEWARTLLPSPSIHSFTNLFFPLQASLILLSASKEWDQCISPALKRGSWSFFPYMPSKWNSNGNDNILSYPAFHFPETTCRQVMLNFVGPPLPHLSNQLNILLFLSS